MLMGLSGIILKRPLYPAVGLLLCSMKRCPQRVLDHQEPREAVQRDVQGAGPILGPAQAGVAPGASLQLAAQPFAGRLRRRAAIHLVRGPLDVLARRIEHKSNPGALLART